MKTLPMSRFRGVTPGFAAWAILPLSIIAVVSSLMPNPVVLWNRSPSEPEGLYVRTGARPLPGTIIAFQAPPQAFPYADARMGYLHHIPILKSVGAGEGQSVCTDGGKLVIDGKVVAPLQSHDSHGDRLPIWHGCRLLGAGEVFVFSDRIPNSFDSRYYGPIKTDQILGVFRPLNAPSASGRNP